jgi:DNA polymerase-3 subunit gamma/tau
MRWAVNKKMHFEVAAIRAIQILQSATLTEVLDTLTALRGGQAPPVSAPPVKPAAPRAEPRPPVQRAQPEPPAPAPAAKPPAAAPRVAEPAKVAEPVKIAEVAKVAEPPPAPARPAISDADFWTALVETVRRERPLLRTSLESGAPTRIEGAVVRIGFPPEQEFSKELIERGHLAFLSATATAILGRKVEVSLEVREGVVSTPVPQAVPVPQADPMEIFKADPLIRKALELFRAEVQPA